MSPNRATQNKSRARLGTLSNVPVTTDPPQSSTEGALDCRNTACSPTPPPPQFPIAAAPGPARALGTSTRPRAHHGCSQAPREMQGRRQAQASPLPVPDAGTRGGFAARRSEPEPSPPWLRHSLCICRLKPSVSSSKNFGRLQNRKHLVLVGAGAALPGPRGGRRGGGARTAHFPSKPFKQLTTLAPALPVTYIPWKCPILPRPAETRPLCTSLASRIGELQRAGMSRQQGTLPPPSRALHKGDLLPLKMFSQLVQDITRVPKFAWRAERLSHAAKLRFGFLWQLPAPAARLLSPAGVG